MSRKISQAGIRLIQNFEGCRLTAYKPVATEQYWTIGWGHYGPDVKQGMTITQAKADAMLVADLVRYETAVNNLNLQLNQNQFDALVSFCYNCGAGNLRKLCLGRTIAQIAQNITKYDKAGGKVLTGLVRRRKAELDLFNKGVEETVADDKKTAPVWKEQGREWLIANAKISPDWKATDQLDVGTLGTILSRLNK
ncbi:Lysozyme RrrD [compost metagenome]